MRQSLVSGRLGRRRQTGEICSAPTEKRGALGTLKRDHLSLIPETTYAKKRELYMGRLWLVSYGVLNRRENIKKYARGF